MMEFTQRTINELLVRYELEPGIKDIFVEGKFDQEVLSNYFRGINKIDIMVYEIDSVEVPSELLIKHNLTEGNKQRVIALARELAELHEECSYRCLVDKDLDHWFGSLELTARLIWTEFTSIELNFFSDDILHEILITTAKAKIRSWEEYVQSLTATLRDLYVLRLADRELGWSLEWLSLDRCLSCDNHLIVFNQTEYVNRLLMKNRKIGLKIQFYSSVAEWNKKLIGDPRYYIRGHDFVDLLAWTVGKFHGIKEFSSALTIQRIFVLLASSKIKFEKAIMQ